LAGGGGNSSEIQPGGGCWTALHGCELTWRIRRPESPGLFSTRNA
jgi:hypothetical protein